MKRKTEPLSSRLFLPNCLSPGASYYNVLQDIIFFKLCFTQYCNEEECVTMYQDVFQGFQGITTKYMYFSDCTILECTFTHTCITKCSQTAFPQSLGLMCAEFICICGFGGENFARCSKELKPICCSHRLWWIQCNLKGLQRGALFVPSCSLQASPRHFGRAPVPTQN